MLYKIIIGELSSAPTGTHSPAVVSSAISHYHTYLRTVYKNSPISPETKWPPTPSREYITLAVVEGEKKCRDEYIGHILQGNVQQLLKRRREISTEQILEACEGKLVACEDKQKMRLILLEGAPGIGKSTLAWELCRKWEEFSSMQRYSLVVLLRLREEEVQNITKVSELFYAYESEDKKSLEEEVLKSQGKGILFILDGFDEFPKNLQRKSFVLNLIKGLVLPESTVLVTSRPSATAQLLKSCRPQKRVEVLGFTQESVQAYANSVFVAEPAEKLQGFKAYISVSNNPAINSLMYVPLNAAIIVQIYRNSKSDSTLPHTFTELYTQLCLTILNRYLDIHYPGSTAVEFKDLPSDLYNQFLSLCKVAFEGILNEAINFKVHPAYKAHFNHFGFLDAVSALYGGGEISYNFLHLTLQEFLAAYYISLLGGMGQELFTHYGRKGHWEVVWRFVAGLTKFTSFKPTDIRRVFFQSHVGIHASCVSNFLIECLFESKTMDFFRYYISSVSALYAEVSQYTSAFVMYALGYCIANIHTGKPWNLKIVTVKSEMFEFFVSGLKTNVPGVGVIKEVELQRTEFTWDNIKFCFPTLESLVMNDCTILTNPFGNPIPLSDYIVHNKFLTKLGITDVNCNLDLLLLVLQQLCQSNVTSLDITDSGFCKHFRESPHDFHLALKNLINPTSGRLRKLSVGKNDFENQNIGDDDDLALKNLIINPTSGRLRKLKLSAGKKDQNIGDDCLVRLISFPSSLRYLSLHTVHSSLLHIMSNTCLTAFILYLPRSKKYRQQQLQTIIDIVKYNRTLHHLEVRELKWSDKALIAIDPLKAIALAVIHENTTLQSVILHISGFGNYPTLSQYMSTHHKGVTEDPRITWSS